MTQDTDTPDRLVQTYRNVTATIVSDALDEHDVGGIITGIDPAHPEHTAIGRARPVDFGPAPEDADRTNFPFDVFREFEPDIVLVFDGISPEVSCWGELASRLAHEAEVGGTVINGGYRDYNGIRSGDYGVFGVQTTPRSGQPRIKVDSIGEPITIDGVTIDDGDIIVADGTGIAVVPEAHAEAVAETAMDILGKELVLDQRVDRGADVETLIAEYDGF